MVNDIIDDKYQIISKIGSGGTSIVYKARRLADDKIVAIKIVREELENNKENERRFYLEAEALSKMSHRNVRRILGIGQWDDSLYMVTEFIDGKTLKDVISEGRINLKNAVDYALQIAAGIEHAHRRDIVHRDIKPQNVIISNDGTVKLVDFGIARMTSKTTRTMAGKDVVGSVHYLSPEQAKGTDADQRSDIYSFGILLYEMFTGKVPFEGTEPVSIAMKHINQIPEPPQSVNPDVPNGINDIIVKCIQKDPEKRYQSAFELREDLLLYVANPDGFSVIKAEMLQGREKTEDNDEAFVPLENMVPQYVVTENEEAKTRKYIDSKRESAKIAAKKRRNKYLVLFGAMALAIIIIILAIVFIPKMLSNKKDHPSNIIPSVTGFTKEVATDYLKQASFLKYKYIETESNDVAEGLVIKTEPEVLSFVSVDTEIIIYISKGPGYVNIENTVGMTFAQAEKILTEKGIKISIEYIEDSDQPDSTVIAQSKTTGTVKYGDTIILSVSKKPTTAKIIAPDLSGMRNISDIKNAITSAGFKVGNIKEIAVSDDTSAGVSKQSVEPYKEFVYPIKSEPPIIQIDVEVKVVKKTYKCVYEFETPEGNAKNFNLIIYDMSGEQVDERNFTSTNKVVYEISGVENQSFVFELYVDNQLADKKILTVKK